jgi:uncharacterized membrane protein
MTPEDRELLQRLRAEEVDLRQALNSLEARLGELEARAAANGAPYFPPLPAVPPHEEMAESALPPTPAAFHPQSTFSPTAAFAKSAAQPVLPEIPAAELPPIPPAAKPQVEFRIGRWLTRLGALFFVLLLISIDSYFHLHQLLGRAGQLALMGAVSIVLVAVGRRLQARAMPGYGRTLMAAGLGGLYFTLYAATAIPPWQLVTNPVAGGLIMLLWSVYVFDLARRMKSEPMAVLALLLAYVSTSLNPMMRFTLGADLLLGGTAVLFLLRYGWLALAYLGLAGTYLAIIRRLLFNEHGEFLFDTSRALAFAPHAVYLIAAWGAFTAGVLFAPALVRREGRLALLTLNNVLGAGLLALSAIICGYGSDRTGWVLLLSGGAMLAVSAAAHVVRPETSGPYAAQGLTFVTGGIMTIFTGASRAALLLIETLLLALGGALSRNRILEIAAWVVSVVATGFLLWNITVETRDPWVLGLGGAAVMLKCAWWTRQRLRAPHFAWPATLYSALGLLLLAALLDTQLTAAELPPALAFVAIAATLLGFALKLGEVQPIAQVLLLAAQGLAYFPSENGETISKWSAGWVMIATLGMMFIVRRTWLKLLDPVYALALVGLLYNMVRPEVTDQEWMIDASVFSFAFLLVGALSRIWSLAAAGQLFLAVAVYYFFQNLTSPWEAMVPLAIVFATGRSIHGWLRTFTEFAGPPRKALRTTAFLYQLLALVMLIDAISVLIPARSLASMYILSGTLVLTVNTLRSKWFGVRCSFVLSGLGAIVIFFTPGHPVMTFVSVMAILSFLTQPGILAHASKPLVTAVESWLLVLVSSLAGWVFVAGDAGARWGGGAITASWTVYALLLILAGFTMGESRQRWCGLAILVAAIVRVFAVDFWALSGGLRVLTFVVLTLVTLGLGYLYARHGEKLKTLL